MADKQLTRYRGMIKVEQEYAASGMTDTEFAASMSTPDVTYTMAQVREWRRVLGIPNNVLPAAQPANVVALKDALREALEHLRLAVATDCTSHTEWHMQQKAFAERVQELLK